MIIKKIIYMVVGVILLNTVLVYLSFDKAYASDVSHEEMVEMYGEGYSKTLFGAMLEANAKMSVNEAENREALDGFINNSKDYIKGRLDSYEQFQGAGASAIPGLFKEMGIGLLTLGETGLDFLKNLFGKSEDIPDFENIDSCEFPSGVQIIMGAEKYDNLWSATPKCGFSISEGVSYLSSDVKTLILNRRIASNITVELDHYVYPPSNIYGLDVLLRRYFDGVYVVYNKEPIQDYVLKEQVINRVVNHIPQKTRLPILKPQATCPEGQRVIVPDGKGGYLDSNGQATNVSDCTITWLAPTIDRDQEGNLQAGYDDEREKIIVEETETVVETECDNVFCFLTEIVKSIGDLATSIVEGILNGLETVFKFLFVPSEGFWSNNLDELQSLMFEDEIDNLLYSANELQDVNSNQATASLDGPQARVQESGGFTDVVVSLMGADDVVLIDSSSVNETLDTFHSWVRGVFYPLLIFFNINSAYRLIRGHSLIGIGRDKGGADS